MTNSKTSDFTPALGSIGSIRLYDRVIALLTREKHWRGKLIAVLTPLEADIIVDIGAGTGSLAILIKKIQPSVRMIAIDPDPEIEKIAENKAAKAGTDLEFISAMGDADLDHLIAPGTVDKVVSSLVLHQCPIPIKKRILGNAFRMLKPGGILYISDYGRQRSVLMKLAFNLVRMTDGYDDTRANKEGKLPDYISEAGFNSIEELNVTSTPTGSISLYKGLKPKT